MQSYTQMDPGVRVGSADPYTQMQMQMAMEESPSSPWPKILGVLLVGGVLVAGGILLYRRQQSPTTPAATTTAPAATTTAPAAGTPAAGTPAADTTPAAATTPDGSVGAPTGSSTTTGTSSSTGNTPGTGGGVETSTTNVAGPPQGYSYDVTALADKIIASNPASVEQCKTSCGTISGCTGWYRCEPGTDCKGCYLFKGDIGEPTATNDMTKYAQKYVNPAQGYFYDWNRIKNQVIGTLDISEQQCKTACDLSPQCSAWEKCQKGTGCAGCYLMGGALPPPSKTGNATHFAALAKHST